MIEDKTVESIENSAVRMTIKVSGETTRQTYDELLTKYQKQAQIPGFRKGKVPRNLFTRKFGEGIAQEATSKIIEEALTEALKDIDKQPCSQPLLQEFHNIDPGQAFEFIITYDVFPEVSLGDYRGLEVEKSQVNISEEDENKQLEFLREQNAVAIDKPDGIITDGTVITMDYVEIGEDGVELENTKREDFVFSLGKDTHPYAIEHDLEGMKVGEEKDLHEVSVDDLNEYQTRLRIRIKAVKERQLPDLDDELAQDISEDLHSLDDLRSKVRSQLKEYADEVIRKRMLKAINEKLIANATIELPESWVNAEIEKTWENFVYSSGGEEEMLAELEREGMSKQDFLEKSRDDAVRELKTGLIHNKIIRMEELETTDEELQIEFENQRNKRHIGPEEYEKLFGYPEYKKYLRNTSTSKKLFDFLLNAASVQSGGVIDFSDLVSD